MQNKSLTRHGLFSRDCQNNVRMQKMIYNEIKIVQLLVLQGGLKHW